MFDATLGSFFIGAVVVVATEERDTEVVLC